MEILSPTGQHWHAKESGHVTQLLHRVSPLNIQDLNVNSPL